MPENRLGVARLASIVGLSALSMGIGLGSSGRLTYHEAFVAQAAREMISGGSWIVSTIDGQPWLEKPPLATWLVAVVGLVTGEVSEFAARAPSAVVACLMTLGIAGFASRRFGPNVGWLAGLIQATTMWTILRGRLAEADILLACLVTGTILAFDRLRSGESVGVARGPHLTRRRLLAGFRSSLVASASPPPRGEGPGERVAASSLMIRSSDLEPSWSVEDPHPDPLPGGEGGSEDPNLGSLSGRGGLALRPDPPLEAPPSPYWRWAFFAGLGASALAKGIGFGAVLAGSAIVVVLLWDRDRRGFRALRNPWGWCLAGVLALTWPVLAAVRLPSAVSLWALHVTDRLSSQPEHFIGGPWWQYVPAVLLQAMPWTPLALIGAGPSIVRAIARRGGPDRLLWAWAVVPVLVLSTATVKNAHYAIHALPPLSVWAALGLIRVGARLRLRGWSEFRVLRGAVLLFLALGLGSGLGHLILGPRLDRRGREWAFVEQVGRQVERATPLVFLYEDWDRNPYPTPFGPMPHDWAIRLYSLERPAVWRQGVEDLAARPPGPGPYALVGRERDLPALRELGRVESVTQGPADRFDRTFALFRVDPVTR
ncbi:ArnT family glycosyltransferase [Tundrisphaera lichenicola]|uniref:ArnT family glycosyltransferase n=1 Tax=Tundrisphaera lichenicola TaxID=2029860 RepID=UPI003EBC100C